MKIRQHSTKTTLRVEALEGRLALSGLANPVHAAVSAHPAAAHVSTVHESTNKAPAVPNPVLVNLTPQTTGSSSPTSRTTPGST